LALYDASPPAADSRERLDALKAALAGNAASLAVELFGEPTGRSGFVWRWGRAGSLAVTVKGRWRGRFKSWEADEGGSMLDAIMFAHGGSFADGVAYGNRLGLSLARPAKPI